MKWTRDGDQFVATGTCGEYRITKWNLRGIISFALSFRTENRNKVEALRRRIEGFVAESYTLKDAKSTALRHNNGMASLKRTLGS